MSAFITVTFTKSESPLHPVAFNIASEKTTLVCKDFVTTAQYKATFTEKNAESALLLVHHLADEKGVYVTAGGRPILRMDKVLNTLECFIGSRFSDKEYYCKKTVEIIDEKYKHDHQTDIGFVPKPTATLPCTLLANIGFRPDPRLKGKNLSGKIQAEAVRASCDWCPNFQIV